MFCEEEMRNLDVTLRQCADEKYRRFQGGLIPNVDMVFYGVRVPVLWKLAKKLLKADWKDFVEQGSQSEVYEMNMLSGMVIALAPCTFEEKLSALKSFIPCINNWAVCDIVCGGMKDIKENMDSMFSFIQPYLKSKEEYEVRFFVVILLTYYICDEYIQDVFRVYDEVEHPGYYVKMAVAWGVSKCFVMYPERTWEYLMSCNLDDFVYNKCIQKMIESHQVSKEEKQKLRKMKRLSTKGGVYETRM